MNTQEAIIKSKQTKRFYDLCKERIADSPDNHFCPFCGEIKKEFFWPPNNERAKLLDCECEIKFRMLKNTYDNYRRCKHKGIFYSDFIDGHKRPANDDENEIMIFGIKLRDELAWAEKKVVMG